MRHLQSLPPDLKRQEAEIERLTDAPAGAQFLLLRDANEEALLQTEERLSPRLAHAEQAGALGGYTAISQFAPSIARQKENRALVIQRLLPGLRAYLVQIGYARTSRLRRARGFSHAGQTSKNRPRCRCFLLRVDMTADSFDPAHVILLRGASNIAAIHSADRQCARRSAGESGG